MNIYNDEDLGMKLYCVNVTCYSDNDNTFPSMIIIINFITVLL